MRVETDATVIDLGTTETKPTIGIIDYSRRVTDDFGVTTVVERGFSRRMSVRFALPFDAADALQRDLASLRATPAMWIADDRYDWLSVNGFYKDFEIDLAVPPNSYCTLTIEGLADSSAIPNPGGEPAPAGHVSTLQLLQPVTINDGVLTASTIAETDHPAWAVDATYATGDHVMVTATHRRYESLIDDNLGNDPASSADKWLDIGPTNRWAMFDQALGTVSSKAGSISVTLEAAIGAVALLDVVAASVRVQAPSYDQTQAVGTGAVTFLDMPLSAGPIIVTITGPGQVSVGTLLAGRLVGLGQTGASPSAGINDYSRKETDDFGEVTIVERAWAKRMSATALIRSDAIDLVANRIAAARARPSLWIGQAGLDSLTIYGFFKDFSIEVGETVSTLSLSIEGLSEAADIAPFTVSTNWPDIGDPDGTKPDDNATHGAPSGTNIGDLPVDDVVGAITDGDGNIIRSVDLDAGIAAAQADIDALSVDVGAVEGFKDAAEAAAQNSEQARDDAQAAYALTDTARGEAIIARNLAQEHEEAASGFADAASGSADIADAKADESEVSAGAAHADAVTAQAAREGSETAAAASVTSEQAAEGHATDAGNYASAAQSSSVTANAGADAARLALAANFPQTLRGDLVVSAPLSGAPSSLSPISQTAPTWVADSGTTILPPKTNYQVGLVAALRLVDGEIYEAVSDLENMLSEPTSALIYLRYMDANYGTVNTATGAATNLGALGSKATIRLRFGKNTSVPGVINITDPTIVFVRIYVLINRSTNSPTSNPNAQIKVRSLYPRSVTGEQNAALSATAAATSESNAAASEDESGQHASAADQSRIDAETAKGQAQGFSTSAALANSNAQGASSTATQSAGVAVTASNTALKTAANGLPSDFAQDGTFWSTSFTGNPATQVPIGSGSGAIGFVTDGTYGRIARITTSGSVDIAQIGVKKVVAGRKYRFTASGFCNHVGAPAMKLYAIRLDSSYSYIGVAGQDNELPINGALQHLSVDVDGTTEIAAGGGYLRLMLRADGQGQTNTFSWVFGLLEDVTDSEAAKQSATAAAGSVTLASAQADLAGQRSTASQTAQASAETAQSLAEASEARTVVSESNAAGSAAAATSALSLTAQYAGNSAAINLDSTFLDWSGVMPNHWALWSGATPTKTSVTGKQELTQAATAGTNAGFRQLYDQPGLNHLSPGWYVVSAEVYLDSGTLIGSGAGLTSYDASNAGLTAQFLKFATDPDSSGSPVGNGVVGRTYRFAKLLHFTDPTMVKGILYGYTNYSTLGVSTTKTLRWTNLDVRAATDQEIAANKATSDIASLGSSVSVNAGAIAGIKNTAAYYDVEVAAAGGNPAKARLYAGATGSAIDLVADTLTIQNSVGGDVVEVARFEGGIARFNEALIRGLKVAPRNDSDIYLDVQLKPLVFLLADGATKQYDDGASFGLPPEKITVDTSGLPALNAGESYSIGAVNITATQFQARIKKLLPGGPVTQASSAGSSGSGTPAWKTNKPTTADTYNQYYQFSFTATLAYVSSQTVHQGLDPPGGTDVTINRYAGSVSLYAYNGTALTLVATIPLSKTTTGTSHASTVTANFSSVIQTSFAIGTGTNRFGIHAGSGTTITAFAGVTYDTQTSSGETAVAGTLAFTVYPPPPNH